jgi:hypothetical protein
MKNLILFILALVVIMKVGAQTPSIAIANPNVTILNTPSETASKYIRMELIKLKRYTIYDEFDMKEAYKTNPEFNDECLSKNCLVNLGKVLKVDYVISGSYDLLSNKIVISLKMIDVKNEKIQNTVVKEFDNNELELQRMTQIAIEELHNIESDADLVKKLSFNNEEITSNNVGRISNSGPRIGLGFMAGSLYEFATRDGRGSLDIFPLVSILGYQYEIQYVGTEKFSALVEFVGTLSGLEQGKFIPSIQILNGFRFGKGRWEFAFGPGFSLKKTSSGFLDTENKIGGGYYSESDWSNYCFSHNGGLYMEPSEIHSTYNFNKKYGDVRGDLGVNFLFVLGAGRTFRAGNLNLPVNVFYSSQKGGGIIGVSVGFNIVLKKQAINTNAK